MVLELKQNYDLSKLSTLRVKASAEFFVAPSSLEELLEIFTEIKNKGYQWNILGAGSNTLLSSRGIPGVLISTNSLDFINKIDEQTYEVGCGMRMPRFCALMAKESLTGTEFMEGIPGSIGGGVVMNAGAHGSEISEILIAAKVIDLETLQVETWTKEKLGFSYRHSKINPHKHLVFSATFQLKADDKEEIRKRISHNNHARTTRQPIKSWTCGCTFKNPSAEIGAGKLIEDLGLKGLSVGDFNISTLHGNFFENRDSGSSQDFCKLMKLVQDKAWTESKLVLKPEVQRMGIFSPEEMKIWEV